MKTINGIKYYLVGNTKKVNHGLVDYTVDAVIIRDGEKIPCKAGYSRINNYSDYYGLTHFFIRAGITENGTHYENETIELK